MIELTQEYNDILVKRVLEKISSSINSKNFTFVVKERLIKVHLKAQNSSKFHQYYFKILNNEEYYKSNPEFFREFRSNYSLQGVDLGYLRNLESRKDQLLASIRNENLSNLYFEVFHQASIKYGTGTIKRNLGSFFTKFVHTFTPEKYCALDNPIKEYFSMKNESFFNAFIVLSTAYKKWATINQNLILEIRTEFNRLDKTGLINHDKLSDLKLLDMVFWSIANKG